MLQAFVGVASPGHCSDGGETSKSGLLPENSTWGLRFPSLARLSAKFSVRYEAAKGLCSLLQQVQIYKTSHHFSPKKILKGKEFGSRVFTLRELQNMQGREFRVVLLQ